MNRTGHRGKVDTTQRMIKAVAEAHGWEVISTAAVGDGFPDLLVYRKPQGFRLVECKSGPNAPFTEAQKKFRRTYTMPVLTVMSGEDAECVFRTLTKEGA